MPTFRWYVFWQGLQCAQKLMALQTHTDELPLDAKTWHGQLFSLLVPVVVCEQQMLKLISTCNNLQFCKEVVTETRTKRTRSSYFE